MARKVVMLEPAPRTALAKAPAAPAALSLEPALETVLAPVTAQAEIARRALDKLKGGRRGRL
jgi:hypothetical protein